MKKSILKIQIIFFILFLGILCINNRTYAAMRTAKITLSNYSYTYNGKEKRPIVTVKYNGIVQKKNKDYRVLYKDNINAGAGKVIIYGLKKSLAGSVTKSFIIKKKSISLCTTSNYTRSYTYDGTEKKPRITVNGLIYNKDYYITYSNNINAGTAKIRIHGKGKNYTGILEKKFTINRRNIANLNLRMEIQKLKYNGKYQKPRLKSVNVILVGLKTLRKNIDYYIKSVSSVKYPKDYCTIIIEGKGNYKGTVKRQFQVIK